MRYGILKDSLGSRDVIEIEEAEYSRIQSARDNLFEVLFIEEKLDLVTENFNEYEIELLSIASRMMIFHDDDYFSMSYERNSVSRRIVNLLSAGRMYIDQSVQHIEKMYGDGSDALDQIKREIAFQYGHSLGYRVMEALRNYVQHRGFPIHSLKFSHERVESGDGFHLRHRAIPLIKVSALEEDRKFKKSVLAELKDIQNMDWVDARPLIREYIESIGKIHEKVREAIHNDLLYWEQILDETISKSQDGFSRDVALSGLTIVVAEDDSRREEKLSIFKEFLERRKILEKKNRFFNNLHRGYASNEIRSTDT